jgi:hypothetical protein
MVLVREGSMHEVVLLIPTRSVAERRLMRAVEKLVSGVNLKVCRDADGLRRRLLPGRHSPLAVVILAVTKQDLLSIMPLRDLLLGFRVVVILPDSDDVTVAMGWGVWPRFVSYADGDLRDVAGVLDKIVGTAPLHMKGDTGQWASAKHKR